MSNSTEEGGETEAVYRSMFEQSPHATLVVNPETGAITAANPPASELLETERAEIHGATFAELGLEPREGTDHRDTDTIPAMVRDGTTPSEWHRRTEAGDSRQLSIDFCRTTVEETPRIVAYLTDQSREGEGDGSDGNTTEILRQLTDATDDVLWMFDADFSELLFVSEAYEDVWGRSIADLRADPMDFIEGVHPDDREIVSDVAAELQAGEPTTTEYRVNEAEDFERWVSVEGEPLTNDDGKVDRIVGYARDITERKKRERRLEENDAILRQLTETSDDVFWLFDADFTEILFVNQAYERVWGRSIADLQDDAMDFMEGVHPDDREIVMSAIADLQAGESTTEEYRVNPEEDFERWVSVRGEPIYEDGEIVRSAGYARDITDRKERERQLQALGEATQELSLAETPEDVAQTVVDIADQVLDQHLTAVWRYDGSGDRLEPWASTERAERFAEQSATGELKPIKAGTTEMNMFKTGDPVTVNDYQSLSNPSSPDAPLGALIMVPIGDKAQLHVGATEANVFGDTEENLLTILATNAETAFERAEREHALEKYKDKLKQSNENLQEFAYVASHDLQEPLRSVTSYLDLLETEYGEALDEEAEFYIERATNNAEQMSTLIDALLQYSRVKTDEGEFTEVDTQAVLDNTLDRLDQLIEETDAEVTTGSLPTVLADRNQLGQVFQNLVSNAIDHGGEPPAIEITAEETADAWIIAVSDNGPGIPEAQHDRIFEIFQQANTDGSGEAGIGLAICERIITRHDGEIWVESDGSGATFKLTLPKERIAEQ